MATNNNMIRMSGMNSGLDTESIINALTANSKLKITKQNRQLLKYQATQEAYREVIDKMRTLQDKYFNLLNSKGNLKGTTMWNQYKTTTYVDGEEKKVAGFSTSTSIDSLPGNYEIEVLNTATQTKLSGRSLNGGAKLNMDSFTDGEEYGLTVTVGSETHNITFTAGATAADTRKVINDKLAELYGESNDSAVTGEGIVYVNSAGEFVSRDGNGISVTDARNLTTSQDLQFGENIKSGNNTVSIQIGDEVINVSFQTLGYDYFTPEPMKDEDGNVVTDDDGNIVYETELDEGKQELLDQITADYVESKKYAAYEEWEATATGLEKETLKQQAFDKAEAAQREKYLDKYLNQEYKDYKKELPEGTEALSFDDWKTANFVDNDENNELYKGFKDYYYDKDISGSLTPEQEAAKQADLDKYVDTQYNKYLNSLGDDEIALSKEAWKTENIGADKDNEVNDGYNAIAKKHDTDLGYQLDRDMWEKISYNEYEAYKEFECSIKGEEDLTFTQKDIINHYNESSLKNSVGAAKTSSGAKLEVSVSTDASGSISGAEIKAYTEETVYEKDEHGENILDENGKPIPVLDADGKPQTEKVYQNLAVTPLKGSENDFGKDPAVTTISQISNSTKLSDLNLAADEKGNFNFEINGVKFSFSEDTTVKEMMRTVSASKANVKMSYSSLDNAFTLTANEYGVGSEIKIDGDANGLLANLGLTQDLVTEGSNLQVKINGKTVESNGNAITADGTTFTFAGVKEGTKFEVNVEKDTAQIADTVKAFVEDYNKLIEDVYKMLDEKPDKDYYFLADADKEEMDLSEKQEEKWEAKAKKGLLYHDSTISSVMTKLRTALMGYTTAADGSDFGLAQMGIKTSSDYKDHGKLVLDEDALMAAINDHGEDISKLFSDATDGIMTKFDQALESAVGTTGDRGTLINKAGLATGTSATDNFIYNQMKRITQRISTLEKRYEREQDRLWKKYSAMETMMGTLNSQSASMSSYFGGMM